MQGKVEICGVNTAELPVLKSAETRALLQRARAGESGAREKLISGNLLSATIRGPFGEALCFEHTDISLPFHREADAVVII